MDRLWFHQIILFSETSSFHAAEDVKTIIHSSKLNSQTHEISTLDEISSEESDDFEKETASDDVEIPTRLNLNRKLVSDKGRCQSSSPEKRWRNQLPSLKKSVSCKTLVDLELEEVKGFMDLGFIFRRDNLTKRIIHLVPGLQRIGASKHEHHIHSCKQIIRPYLSEAWAVRSPNSPLLNLRIPSVSTAADMMKHLKYWAHTVASAIHQY